MKRVNKLKVKNHVWIGLFFIGNGVLAGISLKQDKFFYVNPLASDGTHHRQAWYGCACCPSQVSRFLRSTYPMMHPVPAGRISP